MAQTVYCCIPTEFHEPWEQNDAIRAVHDLRLGNSIIVQHTCHVGNSDEARAEWKRRYPHLAKEIDAVPRFPERPEYGMAALLEMPIEFRVGQLELCRELGLSVICYHPPRMSLSPEDADQLTRAGSGVVLSEMIMGENLSVLSSAIPWEQLKRLDPASPLPADDPEALDFQRMHDWFVGRFRALGERVRANWGGLLSAIESAPAMHLAAQAGADILIHELVPHEPLRGIAATRGAARAYGKDAWGVHAAMGYFRPPADEWTPQRLRIAYNLYFAAGASIFTECNMPLRVTGSCSAFFSVRASPPMRAGESERLDFDHPICAAAREVVADFYRFTQFHQRPAAHPRVGMGFLAGHLDTGMEHMWLVDHPGFRAPAAARMWRHFERIFDAEPWYTPPRKYYWQADPAKPLRFGTPPCGQVDVVPIEAPADVLRSYGCLVLLGWNTMTPAHYANLVEYVRGGGILFLGVPHLSTRTRTDRPQTFIHDGDVRELCGVQILGEGDTVEEVLFANDSSDPCCVMPRGTLYLETAKLARVELHGATPLAVSRDAERPGLPVLLEHRVGNGTVYLLNTWDYPGEHLDAFVTDMLRALADSQQAKIAVRGRDVHYALYDGVLPAAVEYCALYLVNHDIYGQAAHPAVVMVSAKHETPVRVEGRDLRVAWLVQGELLCSPADRYVKLVDARRGDGAVEEADVQELSRDWILTLGSIAPIEGGHVGAERLIQIDSSRGPIRGATLNGRRVPVETLADGERAVRCNLTGRDELRVEVS